MNMLDPQDANALQKVIRNYVRPPCIAPYLGRRPTTIINKPVDGPSGWKEHRLQVSEGCAWGLGPMGLGLSERGSSVGLIVAVCLAIALGDWDVHACMIGH